MKALVDLVTLAHLHTSRAYVPTQTTAIEASPDQHTDSEGEWYFSNKEKQREGPYSFREVCVLSCVSVLMNTEGEETVKLWKSLMQEAGIITRVEMPYFF